MQARTAMVTIGPLAECYAIYKKLYPTIHSSDYYEKSDTHESRMITAFEHHAFFHHPLRNEKKVTVSQSVGCQ